MNRLSRRPAVRLRRVLAMTAVAGLALGPAAFGQQPSAPGPAVQLSHSINDSPSPAPDGRRLVYLTVVAGREQLFVMNTDGSKPVQITRDDADHEDPAWSPDGRRIAYVSIAGGLEVIHLIDPDGSGDEALTPAGQRVIHPNWAPDSRRLAYCTDDDLKPPKKNASEIYSIDIVTRQVTPLITGGTNTYPAWSPDGSKMAFRRMLGESNSEVFLANGDGSDPRNLSNSSAFDGWPAWSPAGSRIAFASNRAANYKIYVMRADGSDVRLVAETPGRATAPKWSVDGTTIYFPVCRKVDAGFDCQIFTAPAPPLTP